MDNSPHVPFFIPITDELKKHGVEVVLTARNMYQTRELLDFFQVPCKVIGSHYGKNKTLKLFCNCLRTFNSRRPQQCPARIWRFRTVLAPSCSSRRCLAFRQ